MKATTKYVGLDVHKSTISVAVAEEGRRGEIRNFGVVENRPDVLIKLQERLGGRKHKLNFCYEAGPCGYGLHRLLTGLGHECIVVAPSLIPKKTGDRVKTNRRDALMLARLHRAGELTSVWVPDAAHEAMRDLVRARATAARVLTEARQHLTGFLLRHGKVYAGPRAWTLAYRRWLTTVAFAHPAQQIVLQDYIHAIEDAEARVARLVAQIEQLVEQWSMAPVVGAIQAMRGIAFINAVTLTAEIGDFTRFENPRQLMAYVGLVPSEHSSGDSVRGWHHEGWKQSGSTSFDRRRLDLSDASKGQQKTPGSDRRPAKGHSGYRMESPIAPLRSISPPYRNREEECGRHNRDSAGNDRLRLGNRP
jgi:transposase